MTARRASLVWLLAALAGCGAATTPANDAGADRAQPLDSSASPDSAPPDATQPDSALEDSAADAPHDAMADSGRDVANDTPADAPADVPADTPAHLEPSCDARRVLCDRPEPVCGRGEAPSVVGSCWGPCIAATSCACASDEECPRVPGYSEVCYRTRMRCGPLL